MHSKDWTFAGFGMALAIVGGVGEARHDIVLGIVAVVVGLTTWVICSGATWTCDASDAMQTKWQDDECHSQPNTLEPLVDASEVGGRGLS